MDEFQPRDRVQVYQREDGSTSVVLDDGETITLPWEEVWLGRVGVIIKPTRTNFYSVMWEERYIDGKRVTSDGGGWSAKNLRKIPWPECPECGQPVRFYMDDYLCEECRAKI